MREPLRDRPTRPVRRSRLRAAGGLAIAAIAAAAAALIVSFVDSGTSDSLRAQAQAQVQAPARPALLTTGTTTPASTGQAAPPAGAPARRHRPRTAKRRAPPPRARVFSIATVTVAVSDPARTMTVRGRRRPRRFPVIIRYPLGLDRLPLSAPVPLVVFGHGFAVTPAPYSLLLDAWARAGYMVASPVFPLENANAPGGPDEQDLPNQPGDISRVISLLTGSSARIDGLPDRADSRRIAVSGQSDGGDTALAAAFDPAVRDRRIVAAMILSGAEDPFARPFQMPRDGPPLLAVQGTADTINPPATTYQYYNEASPPRFLLTLPGAGHQPPYTEAGPELDSVERATIAFLDRYLRQRTHAWDRLVARHSAGSGSRLDGDP